MELDKDGDGTVSLAEFREVLTDKPVLFECFFGKSINTDLVRCLVCILMLSFPTPTELLCCVFVGFFPCVALLAFC